nr:PASTA domain-containing protein [Herbiconiux sp. VKM Ac-2851]
MLGSGGDASVYRAHDERTGRTVALKILHAHLGTVVGAGDVFLARARQAAAVRHPALAAVLAFGVDDAADSQPWIALELIAGRTLRDEVEARGPLGAAEGAALLGDVLEGLGALHSSGLVHRDVTPANIMVDGTGPRPRAVLLDLGLAAPAGERSAEPVDDSSALLVRGTVDWMSPEQILGDVVDGRADLYQAAAVLYFALTGEPPFPRDTADAVQRAHLSAPPPVASARAADVPRAIDRVIARAMLKSPDARPHDARELLRELQTALPGQHTAPEAGRHPDGVPPPTARYPLPLPPPADDRTLLLPSATRVRRPQPTAAAHEQASASGRRLVVPVVVLAAVVGLGAVWFMASTSARSSAVAPPVASSAPATPPAPSPPAPTPTVIAAPVVETVAVPAVVGGTADDLAALLAAHGLTVGEVTTAPSASAARVVLSSSPAAGAAVERGSAVAVVISSGENTVPPVVGLDETAATAAVRGAGFAVAVTTASGTGTAAPSAPPGAPAIVASYPAAGTLLLLGQTVTIVREAPAVPATSTPSPTPGPPGPTAAPTPAPTGAPSAPGAAGIRNPASRLVKASFTASSSPVHPVTRACGRDTGSEGKARP